MNGIHRMVITSFVLLVILSLLGVRAGHAVDQIHSVAIVSSVNGDARVSHGNQGPHTGQPKFRGPIIYGDHLSTGKDATLGLLVGQNSLLTMKELSEVRVAESVKNQQVLEVAKGKVCLAVSQPTDTGARPLTVRTPASLITATAGTLLSVDVEEPPQKSQLKNEGNAVAIPVAMSTQASKISVVETYQVMEGSIDIVSLASSAPRTTLRTGQSLRVVGGVRGQPSVAPPVNCRAQDLQIIPVHTVPPPPAQQMIVQQQMQIASAEPAAAAPQAPTAPSGTVAAMATSSNAGGTSTSSAPLIPTNVHIPTTGVPAADLGQTIRTTIQVRLP